MALETIYEIIQLMEDYQSYVDNHNDEIYNEAYPHTHELINADFKGFVEYCKEVLPTLKQKKNEKKQVR